MLMQHAILVEFVASVVTPRFPGGFSVWEARGEWRSAGGSIAREKSFVLNVVHPPGHGADESLASIVAAYKERFAQEAVLRVRSPACSSS